MFWIGMIVGMIIALGAVLGYFLNILIPLGVSYDDMVALGEAGLEAFVNRESQLQVWHDNECLFEATFEEK